MRQLRWTRRSWSKDTDRAYHERLYAAQDYDPFRADYPGYVTIRRFADHAEGLLPATGTVLDAGCGPGEITCELARRHPELSFLGIDHSAQAIARGRRNAARLSLTNVRFAASDAESLPPGDMYGLVTLFDAFHHLERPAAFLAWLRAHTSRCLLIEPAGTPTGGWARALELDWLLFDLDKIRERLEAECGITGEPDEAGRIEPPAVPRGEGAVERRYALADFVELFEGWTLRVTGTLAGFDSYPPRPHDTGGLRPAMGDALYDLICRTEALLVEADRDGAAKHWVIAGAREPGIISARLPTVGVPDAPQTTGTTIASACDVRYANYEGPSAVIAGAGFRASLEVANAGWDTWRSDGPHPVRVSYHWLTPSGAVAHYEGLRTDLPRPLGPGDACHVLATIEAPRDPGRYVLALDLVKEGVTWFSDAGQPWHRIEMRVKR